MGQKVHPLGFRVGITIVNFYKKIIFIMVEMFI